MSNFTPQFLRTMQPFKNSNFNVMSGQSRYEQLLSTTLDMLFDIEKDSIEKRVKCCELEVNDTTKRLIKEPKLHLQNELSNIPTFKFDVSEKIYAYTSWVKSWNPKKKSKIPNDISKEKFISKAKNWRNGRRAIEYSNTLFPDIFEASIKYAKFVSNTINTDKKRQQLLFNILKNAVIFHLLDAKVGLSDYSSTKPLICYNAILRRNSAVYNLILHELPNDNKMCINNVELLKSVFKEQMINGIDILCNYDNTGTFLNTNKKIVNTNNIQNMNDIQLNRYQIGNNNNNNNNEKNSVNLQTFNSNNSVNSINSVNSAVNTVTMNNFPNGYNKVTSQQMSLSTIQYHPYMKPRTTNINNSVVPQQNMFYENRINQLQRLVNNYITTTNCLRNQLASANQQNNFYIQQINTLNQQLHQKNNIIDNIQTTNNFNQSLNANSVDSFIGSLPPNNSLAPTDSISPFQLSLHDNISGESSSTNNDNIMQSKFSENLDLMNDGDFHFLNYNKFDNNNNINSTKNTFNFNKSNYDL